MNNISYTQINYNTFNHALPQNNDLNITQYLTVPREIGDLHYQIVAMCRLKVQSYAEKGHFYIFAYNYVSRNGFNNPEFITYVQQAIDGTAYTPMVGGSITSGVIIAAVDNCFTGMIGRLVMAFQQDPNLTNQIRQLMGSCDWNLVINNYNAYVENTINTFLRMKQAQLNQGMQQQQPQMYGQQQQQYGQPQMQYGQMPMQPGYQQQPQMNGYQNATINTQAVGDGRFAQTNNTFVHQPMETVSKTHVADPYDLDGAAPLQEPQQQQPGGFDLYQPIQFDQPSYSKISELSDEGVSYQPTAVPVMHDSFDSAMDNAADEFEEPVPRNADEVEFVPGRFGPISNVDRPYDCFVANGGVVVMSHPQAARDHIKCECFHTYDIVSRVGFLCIWPNGRMEFKTMPVTKETTYVVNEMFKRSLLFTGDDFSTGYRAMQELQGNTEELVTRPKDYRDLTDKELQDHEPLDLTVEIEGETEEERDTVASELVLNRDGALTGVVSYHSTKHIPLATGTRDGGMYLRTTLLETTELTGLAKTLKRLVKDNDILETSYRQINKRLTKALNSFFRTEVNERIFLDDFIEDIDGLMEMLEQDKPDLAEHISKSTPNFINRVMSIYIDIDEETEEDEDDVTVDKNSPKPVYILEDQLNILLPLHSMNFTTVLMQQCFGVRFVGPTHQRVRGLIKYHLENTQSTRIRLVTSDGMEFWATPGMNDGVMLTIDPEHI